MKWILAPFVLLAVACASPADTTAETAPDKPSYNLEELQAVAYKACQCEMRSGDEEACWADFNNETSGLETSGGMEGSIPLGAKFICFDDEQQDCIDAGSIFLGGDETGLVCSQQQAKEVEALYEKFIKDSAGDHQLANKAAAELISQLAEQLPSQTS